MSTMNIILPESLKDFVESKVKDGSCSTNSEYVKALIRKDLECEKFRNILLEGARSPRSEQALDQHYFQNLRNKVFSK
ncbi:ribbon-helix-helix domain-containing protein [Ignatzschineria cameli]|uniref:Antitoxin ParD n=1 Tax=Ignatzschineria cameli TaxID=2182793 RepID=A0A2U2AKD2_9GAMM|nr:type II toxin-antitoxin system ParD family antitoxin [Ignatzschineria cameli]PWD83261.1 type II toxin-antitoxin system ParD family antitoxin [Ignatzschineria cameli]